MQCRGPETVGSQSNEVTQRFSLYIYSYNIIHDLVSIQDYVAKTRSLSSSAFIILSPGSFY